MAGTHFTPHIILLKAIGVSGQIWAKMRTLVNEVRQQCFADARKLCYFHPEGSIGLKYNFHLPLALSVH
jgi:hypothetical protein